MSTPSSYQGPELHTERLRLEPLTHAHGDALHTLCIDPEVRRYLFADRVIDQQQVTDMINGSLACFAQFGTGFYAIYGAQTEAMSQHPISGQFAGFCGLRLFEDQSQMELLVGFDPQIWGRGFGVEAAYAVMQDGFQRCNIPHVLAAADTPNQRSIRVLQKLGMSFLERRQWHGLDTMFYEVSAAEFLQQRAMLGQ